MAKAIIWIILLSFFVTVVTFFGGNFWKMADIPKPILFVFDSAASDRLTRQIASDRGEVLVTRFFHNKVLSAGNTAFVNLSRATDLTFLFTLTGESSSYENVGKIWMLLPPEILVFFLVIYFWVIKGSVLWAKYKAVIFFLGLSLLLVVVISPVFYLPKFFPFLVMLRVFTYLSFWEWAKNLSSSR